MWERLQVERLGIQRGSAGLPYISKVVHSQTGKLVLRGPGAMDSGYPRGMRMDTADWRVVADSERI